VAGHRTSWCAAPSAPCCQCFQAAVIPQKEPLVPRTPKSHLRRIHNHSSCLPHNLARYLQRYPVGPQHDLRVRVRWIPKHSNCDRTHCSKPFVSMSGKHSITRHYKTRFCASRSGLGRSNRELTNPYLQAGHLVAWLPRARQIGNFLRHWDVCDMALQDGAWYQVP
jgi:hypothetical protein